MVLKSRVEESSFGVSEAEDIVVLCKVNFETITVVFDAAIKDEEAAVNGGVDDADLIVEGEDVLEETVEELYFSVGLLRDKLGKML